MRVYVDGAVKAHQKKEARSGYIAVVYDEERLVEKVGAVTSNQAEYLSIIKAMELALKRGQKNLEVLSDSQLLVKQLQGTYRVKSESIKRLFARVGILRRNFVYFTIKWIPREQNLAGKLLE